MFRIRKVLDPLSPGNKDTIEQVRSILAAQFPTARQIDLQKIPDQLLDPLRFRYRSVLFVAENSRGKVKGFAVTLHLTDFNILYLELISAAPGITGGGIGSALYDRVREEARTLGTEGLYFECNIDSPDIIKDPTILGQNRARLKFYEAYGARPIINNRYDSPVHPGDIDLYYLVFDDLGTPRKVARKRLRRIVTAILDRKYHDIMTAEAIDDVADSFTDPFMQLRPYQYRKKAALQERPKSAYATPLIVNDGHDIHHVRDKGYVESPVRLPKILAELDKSGLFVRKEPQKAPEKLLREVHDPLFVSYLRRACTQLPAGKSIYPIIFPLRNLERPPRDFELELGYYCMDSFTPLNGNAYKAARGAVNCAYTAAREVLNGERFAYALVRPPGHHAEKRFFGGFCYFNSSAVAAHFLSAFGPVAVLDLDYHHGNGTQNIFYRRSDVFTVSIHGAPPKIYPHFAGFADERGEGPGDGFNLNLPLPEQITADKYRKALERALKAIRKFQPEFLVVALGLDPAKDDPTGTWPLLATDFHENGRMVGNAGIPTVVVQEGGYRTRTLGVNARAFLEGLIKVN